MAESLQKLTYTLAALGDLGQEIADTGEFNEMMRSTLHAVLGALAIRRGAVAEYDAERSEFNLIAARGAISPNNSTTLPLARAAVDVLLKRGENRAEVGLIKHTPAQKNGNVVAFERRVDWQTRLEFNRLLESLNCELIAPLIVRGELQGAMLLGAKASGQPFTRDEHNLIRTMARQLAVGLHNHRLLREVAQRAAENLNLYEELRATYQRTVEAFAAAIDCKDAYTQGHSQRVGRYCAVIARELGWSETEIEGVTIAGYLHDVGKLIVDREILNAPYRLEAKQFAEFRNHPVTGYEILSRIRHPYADIPRMVLYHHERLDGQGYPEGITDEAIPVGAKIIALADSFDAMTTDRPYRRRRKFEEVMTELRDGIGKQFAAEIVRAFCQAWLKELNDETRDRTFTRLLGRDYIEREAAAANLENLIFELKSRAAA
jgi:HD-GYP domain-containing protein (c-di-GMP phosphodiesterase class II)